MTKPNEPTHEQLAKQVKSSKQSLLATMDLYGIDALQAEIQVKTLIDAVRRLAEKELY